MKENRQVVELAYRAYGPAAAPPLVLLHALGESGADWHDLAGRLATGWRGYAPDPAWWDRLSVITAPTLVVAGGPDSHLPQDQLAALAARIPHGRLVTIPAGHLVHAAQPAAFLSALHGFLAGSGMVDR